MISADVQRFPGEGDTSLGLRNKALPVQRAKGMGVFGREMAVRQGEWLLRLVLLKHKVRHSVSI